MDTDREAEITYFIQQYSDAAIRKMEFRFFKNSYMWTAMFYVDAYAMENWEHAGEVTCESREEAISKCCVMAEGLAFRKAADELQRRGVR